MGISCFGPSRTKDIEELKETASSDKIISKTTQPTLHWTKYDTIQYHCKESEAARVYLSKYLEDELMWPQGSFSFQIEGCLL